MFKKILIGLLIFFFCFLLIPNVIIASSHTYYPTEKVSGLVKNPGMGWVLYCDAFGQMTDGSFPDDNKCVFNPTLFWNAFDRSGATEKANIFYLRAPWSFFEMDEGEFAWDGDEDYQALIQGALDRDLKLAFRVYTDSQDSWQQATPNYVKEAGAKGFVNSYWTPYVNDPVFLEKYTTFIAQFGKKYNDPAVVNYIDGM